MKEYLLFYDAIFGGLPEQLLDGNCLLETPSHDQKLGTFIPTTSLLGKGEGRGNLVNNQQCLCDEASIKTSKVEHLKNSWVGEQIHVPGGQHNPTLQGQNLFCSEPFWTSLHVPLHLTVHLQLCNTLYNKPVNCIVDIKALQVF